MDQRGGLAETIRATDVPLVVEAYNRTVALAPQRPLAGLDFLVPSHDGRGAAATSTSEKVMAKALYNRSEPLIIGEERAAPPDYEVPLRARRSDTGVGEIDLLGVGVESARPWVVELKLHPTQILR